MRARLAQYTNEFVSLAVMALMSIALIAGQAGATQAPADEPAAEVVEHVLVVDIDFRIRHEGE
jgi:hypothetical protein